LPACHQDDKIMFSKEEVVMDYTSIVVLASLSLLKLTCLRKKMLHCWTSTQNN